MTKLPVEGDYTLSDQAHRGFMKALAISATGGLGGLIGLVLSLVIPQATLLLIPFTLLFILGSLASIVLIPAAWILATSGGHAASLGSRVRAWFARSGARTTFLKERKQPLLEDTSSPDRQDGGPR